jgi:hypothetical protein
MPVNGTIVNQVAAAGWPAGESPQEPATSLQPEASMKCNAVKSKLLAGARAGLEELR